MIERRIEAVNKMGYSVKFYYDNTNRRYQVRISKEGGLHGLTMSISGEGESVKDYNDALLQAVGKVQNQCEFLLKRATEFYDFNFNSVTK